MKIEDLHLEKQICHRLYMASNAITRLYRPALEELNLTYPQYILMMALWKVEKASILELQKLTKIDSGSLTLILKKIQKKKYLKITVDEDDKRKRIVSLTVKGFELREKAKTIPSSMSCKINTLSEKEITQLVSILDKLNNQLSILSEEDS